ncbi:hypothetical protein [Mycobacterium phage Weirdo19]|uniref:Uncharacterized protein n=1 Tax=Mycobacterium phage Weirdo19 TaxID=2601610 RepID=A0A6M2YST6_9CAUD|nr:hypothetical protein KDJ11_gp36 [Mycobacterium phage Weirdo19]QEA10804.1 hypothetical protein [Mycobacterium phage Weirdo19]
MPETSGRQRSGTCKVCEGPVRSYPVPVDDEGATVADNDTDRWAHLNPADWMDNPHAPDPQENSTDADHHGEN